MIARVEKLGDKASVYEKRGLDPLRRRLLRHRRKQRVMELAGGLSYLVWRLVSDQRHVGMAAGSILFDAVDRMFDYLEIESMSERMELWGQIREIDNVFLTVMNNKDKADSNVVKKKGSP